MGAFSFECISFHFIVFPPPCTRTSILRIYTVPSLSPPLKPLRPLGIRRLIRPPRLAPVPFPRHPFVPPRMQVDALVVQLLALEHDRVAVLAVGAEAADALVLRQRRGRPGIVVTAVVRGGQVGRIGRGQILVCLRYFFLCRVQVRRGWSVSNCPTVRSPLQTSRTERERTPAHTSVCFPHWPLKAATVAASP